MRFFRRVSRAFERFVNSFAGAAIASRAENATQRGVDAAAVVGALGELEQRSGDEQPRR
jgi:hypothetical protein